MPFLVLWTVSLSEEPSISLHVFVDRSGHAPRIDVGVSLRIHEGIFRFDVPYSHAVRLIDSQRVSKQENG